MKKLEVSKRYVKETVLEIDIHLIVDCTRNKIWFKESEVASMVMKHFEGVFELQNNTQLLIVDQDYTFDCVNGIVLKKTIYGDVAALTENEKVLDFVKI